MRKGQPSPMKGIGRFGKITCVRLPQEVLDALAAAAKAGYRTRSAEILMRLERSLWDEHGRIINPLPDGANEKRAGFLG